MKKIVIVGATSGIGLLLVEEFAKRGWIVGAAGRNLSAIERLATAFQNRVFVRRIDINGADASDELEKLIAEMGGMDVYFHVAGIGFDNLQLSEREEVAVMETNVVGFTRMVDAAFRWFRDNRSGYGKIAAITSVAGTNGIGCLPSYSVSKSFQQCYLRALEQICRIEKLRIKFTDIRPGWIRTPLLNEGQSYPMIMSLPYAVKRIIRAVERGNRVAVIDWRWRLLVGLWRVVPNWLWVRLPIRVSSISSHRD